MSAAADDSAFREAVRGLEAGDFSRLAPLFGRGASDRCAIVEWHERGRFAAEPRALAEALSCACFLGRTPVVRYLLDRGVDPAAGNATGLDAFHWAANRGQLEVVKLLLERGAPLETRNRFDGTVLGVAVWSALHEPRPDHPAIIADLLAAGARVEEAGYPTGDRRLDALIERHRATP